MTTGKYENNLLSNDKIIKRALSSGKGSERVLKGRPNNPQFWTIQVLRCGLWKTGLEVKAETHNQGAVCSNPGPFYNSKAKYLIDQIKKQR